MHVSFKRGPGAASPGSGPETLFKEAKNYKYKLGTPGIVIVTGKREERRKWIYIDR